MFYDKELAFLRSVLERCGVETKIIDSCELSHAVESSLAELLPSMTRGALIAPIEGELSVAMYRLTDSIGRRFICLPLAECGSSALLVGPYHASRPGESALLELGERLGVSPKNQKYLNEYMLSLPLIAEGDPLGRMINAFCELMWQTAAFPIIDPKSPDLSSPSPLLDDVGEKGLDDAAINMLAIEKRYAFENKLISAVSLGQLHKESQLLVAMNEEMFERRIADPIRNAKNYGIIMNTLLRKAAESGGVHPVYIDRTSGEMAARIEGLTDLSASNLLMQEMFRTYCRLVRKHSTGKYSQVVQRAIITIDTDLSASLSLSTLAESQSVSAGYLSATFKREVGMTVSEYIRERRMKHARHLLATTTLQVQTVALHCGILDVQYFSKLFKRTTGKTPREYREEVRGSQDSVEI